MTKLSVLIPARNEPYLNRTIRDVLEKAIGDVDVYAILDGYEPSEILKDDRIHYLRIPLGDGKAHMRQGMNMAVEMTDATHLMKLDAHCLMAPGFDKQLIADNEPDWIQVPRRLRLDVEKWEIVEDGRPPVDYEYLIFRNLLENGNRLRSKGFFWGTPWDELTEKRKDLKIDDTPHFQGSCFFLSKEWYVKNGFMSLAYTGWGQEAEELTFSTLKAGGQVKVNKNTYYAHLHKNAEARKWFDFKEDDLAEMYAHSYNTWVRDNKEFFIDFIESFPIMPDWPHNWKDMLWPN